MGQALTKPMSLLLSPAIPECLSHSLIANNPRLKAFVATANCLHARAAQDALRCWRNKVNKNERRPLVDTRIRVLIGSERCYPEK